MSRIRRYGLTPFHKPRPSKRPAALLNHPHGLAPVANKQQLWLFDLDNTLHNASHAIFPAIDKKMNEAVEHLLNVDALSANQLRQLYWRRYGATLIGMLKHHGVDAHDFLARSHDFSVQEKIAFDSKIVRWLKQLSGRKIIVTNAPAAYARDVLKVMGIERYFDGIWSVEDMCIHGRFRVKPSLHLLRYILAQEGVKPHQCIFVEDTLANLRPAKQLGMRTVWIAHPGTPITRLHAGKPKYVDYRYTSLTRHRS